MIKIFEFIFAGPDPPGMKLPCPEPFAYANQQRRKCKFLARSRLAPLRGCFLIVLGGGKTNVKKNHL